MHRRHNQLTAHIHYIAVKEGLSTRFHEKNNLTDTELAIMFRHITIQDHGIDNLKQHYAAWLLAFITGARPGSFTVGGGYHRDAPIGSSILPNFPTRPTDETMRWKDIEFLRMPGGIAAKLTFRYVKGHRNPYSNSYIAGQRDFLFVPTQGSRYEFDLSVIFFGIAFRTYH
jgi:hypothetical protein